MQFTANIKRTGSPISLNGTLDAYFGEFELFNTDKSKEFLRKSGQLNVSCIRIADENLVKILIIWEYEDEEAFVRCQKLWSKWGDIAQEFVSKIVFNRGKQFYNW